MATACPECLSYAADEIAPGADAESCPVQASWYSDPLTAAPTQDGGLPADDATADGGPLSDGGHVSDGGTADGGTADGGHVSDGGPPDGGPLSDGGPSSDAVFDAGNDANSDAANGEGPAENDGCSCDSTGGATDSAAGRWPLMVLLVICLGVVRGRRQRRVRGSFAVHPVQG